MFAQQGDPSGLVPAPRDAWLDGDDGTEQGLPPPPRLVGPMKRLVPGYYAVSATLVYGLPWRLYDPSPAIPDAWAPAWNAGQDAFGYFRQLTPIDHIGYSIYVYKLSQEDVDRLAPLLKE